MFVSASHFVVTAFERLPGLDGLVILILGLLICGWRLPGVKEQYQGRPKVDIQERIGWRYGNDGEYGQFIRLVLLILLCLWILTTFRK